MCTLDLDTTATTAMTTPPAIATEAGSREAPALPPGLLTDNAEASGRPTKLFIGGISRHTTTKQLRDHFSQFGRVLDCVAMRQPDGRPRGFGYVTLDSPNAADRCLREPQMIDNRIVDMKLAVPEGSSGHTSPSQASYTPKMFPAQADYHMGLLGGHAYGGWPETSGAFCNPSLLWAGAKTSPASQGLDCADLLTAARELSQASQPHGLQLHSMGMRDYADFSSLDPLDTIGVGNQVHSNLIPEEFQQPAGGKMSASAPEFVPSGSQAPQRSQKSGAAETPANQVGVTPQSQKPRSRAPLGELTNIVVEVGDLLKPFESPTNKNKLAGMAHGHLSSANHTDNTGLPNRMRPTGLLLGDDAESSSPSSSSDAHLVPISPDSSSPEPERVEPKVEENAENKAPEKEAEVKKGCDDVEDTAELKNGPASSAASYGDESSGEGSSVDGEAVVVDLDALPSIGSAAHATGECKRCNFFPKGRCQNGKNCTFCHYPHDKRKPSRQEKRERRAAWLEQQSDHVQELPQRSFQEEMMQHPTGPLLSTHGLQQGCMPMYTDEDIFSGETLAYSIFPGLPPIHATKLPAPLPLPGMDMPSRSGPALPPGLAPPGSLTKQPWQPEAEASPASHTLLSTGHTMPGMFDNSCVQQVVSSTTRTGTFLGTVPTPLRTSPPSTAASTPMPTPMATPTAALTASAEARSFVPVATSSATSGTQTGDYMCKKCEVEFKENHSTEDGRNSRGKQGRQWSREELLRLRDGLGKAFETGKSSVLPHTKAIAACPSI